MKKIILLFCFIALSICNVMAQTTDVITNRNSYAVLIDGNDLYYTMFVQGTVSKIDLTDPMLTETVLITGLNQPIGLALNGNDLYISELGTTRISKIDITDATPVLTPVINGPIAYGMAINGNDLYFTKFNNGFVSRLDLTAAVPTEVNIVAGLSQPIDLLLKDNDLYIAELGNTRISKIDITNATPVLTNVITGPRAYGMEIKNNELYFTQLLQGKISKIDLSASTPTEVEVITGLNQPVDLAFHDTDIYISEIGSSKISMFDASTLSLPSQSIHNQVKLFPNPSPNYINLDGVAQGNIIKVADVNGRIIKQLSYASGESIYIGDLTSGVYALIIEGNNSKQSVKFIKE